MVNRNSNQRSLKTDINIILFLVGLIPFFLVSGLLYFSVRQNQTQAIQAEAEARTQSQFALALQLRQLEQSVGLLIQSNELASLLNAPEALRGYSVNLFASKVSAMQNSAGFRVQNLIVFNNENKDIFSLSSAPHDLHKEYLDNTGFHLDSINRKIIYGRVVLMDDQFQDSASARKLGFIYAQIDLKELLAPLQTIRDIHKLPLQIDPQQIEVELERPEDSSNMVLIYLITVATLFVLALILGALHIKRKILDPINALNLHVKTQTPLIGEIESQSHSKNEILQLRKTFDQFSDNIRKANEKLLEKSKNEVTADLARQVAHDIRSPLSALNMVMSTLATLPEEKRLLVRNAVTRISDIANILLNKGDLAAQVDSSKPASAELIPAIVDSLVSEKRLQYRDRINIEIETDFRDSYGSFALTSLTELKRILSNLINNSVEALNKGLILVSVQSKNNRVQIMVKDNGKGIPPEVLSRLGEKGVTFGKEDHGQSGSGLGVYHAKSTVEKLGGSFKIESKLNEGTLITIDLPQAAAPKWFAERVSIPHGAVVVSVDDDTSIHQIWLERIRSLYSEKSAVDIVSFTSAQGFREWHTTKPSVPILYLIDYEFLGQNMTGLDLIEELDIAENSILVTSRYEEPPVQTRAMRLGVRIVPKLMASLVPIIANS